MEITGKRVLLRDYEKSDIEDHIRWNTIDTEWKRWDTPWVRTLVFEEEAYREKMLKKCAKELSTQQMRFSFEICVFREQRTQPVHIGWMNAYTINRNYEPTDGEGDIALGIDIPDKEFRGCGYGKEAFSLFMEYLKNQGYRDLYTQTWSGNEAMISLAKGLGFILCSRKPNVWKENGKEYDVLTFVY